MVLRRGNSGDPVKVLQRGLNKLGAMLLVDGDYGQGTEAAVADARETLAMPGPANVADDALQAAVAAIPDPFPPLTAAGVTFIARTGSHRRGAVSHAVPDAVLAREEEWHHDRHRVRLFVCRSGPVCAPTGASQLGADAIAQLAGVVRQVGSDALLRGERHRGSAHGGDEGLHDVHAATLPRGRAQGLSAD